METQAFVQLVKDTLKQGGVTVDEIIVSSRRRSTLGTFRVKNGWHKSLLFSAGFVTANGIDNCLALIRHEVAHVMVYSEDGCMGGHSSFQYHQACERLKMNRGEDSAKWKGPMPGFTFRPEVTNLVIHMVNPAPKRKVLSLEIRRR